MFVYFAQKVTTIALAMMVFSSEAVFANQWNDVVHIEQCRALAADEAEFQHCRRDLSVRNFETLLQWKRHAKSELSQLGEDERTAYQVTLHSVLQMDEGEFLDWRDEHIPFKLEDPLHYIIVVWRNYPEYFTQALDANQRYMAEIDSTVAEDVIEAAEWLEWRLKNQLNLFSPNYLCEQALPDLGCPTSFGDAFGPHPSPEDIIS